MKQTIVLTVISLLLFAGHAIGEECPFTQLTRREAVARSYQFTASAKSPDVILPYLGKGAAPQWEKAWKSQNFTVQYQKAVALAHAFQGGGEWKQLVPKMLVPKQDTFLEAGWTDEALLLKVTAFQKQMARVTAVPVKYGRDGNVYNNENIDISFATSRNSSHYWQIICDIKGITYDAYQCRDGNHDISWNPNLKLNVEHLADRWVLTIALPLKELGFTMTPGNYVDINVGRVELTQSEVSSLGPIDREFKEPDRMVRMWFGKATPMPSLCKIALENPVIGKNEVAVSVANGTQLPFNGKLCLGKQEYGCSLAAGEQKEMRLSWSAAKESRTLEVRLLDAKGATVDTATIHLTIPPELELLISAREIIAGSPVSAEVKISTGRKVAAMEVAFGNRKCTVPVDFSRAVMTLNSSDLSGTQQLAITLKDKEGTIIAFAEKALAIQDDPFAE